MSDSISASTKRRRRRRSIRAYRCAFKLAVLRTVRVTTADLRAVGSQQAFSRDMIDLQSCAVRILEQHRVVTWRKTVLLRSVNNVRADPFQEIMGFVDIGSLASTKTMVMQSD